MTSEPIWEIPSRPPWVRVINTVGGGLRRVGVRWPKVDAGAMLATARRRTGLNDFGDDRFREGLDVLIDTFNAMDNSHAFGRIFFREFCTELLSNRLKIQSDLTRHPEIRDVPVRRPLFITGLARSGTTFLHRLISEDPSARTMLTWESMEPSPPPEPRTYHNDPRIERTRRKLAMLYRLSPRLATAHEFGAEIPEEDNNLFAHSFLAAILGFLFDVPDYARWMNSRTEADHLANYRYAREQLQLMSWKFDADHWVLKAPAHQYTLGALLTVFPDACVVVTHRDPLQMIPSLCSLAAALRGILTDRVDLHRLGLELTEAAAAGPTRVIEARAKIDPARLYDVPYSRLTADPIGTIQGVCSHFGYDFSPAFETRARAWLASNPQHKHGAHRYRLDDFGLDASTVRGHFAPYLDWLAANLPNVV